MHCKYMNLAEPATVTHVPETIAVLDGCCVRHAPVADEDGAPIWPFVNDANYCGDFELKYRSEFAICYQKQYDS
jgi:hypothetical protein